MDASPAQPEDVRDVAVAELAQKLLAQLSGPQDVEERYAVITTQMSKHSLTSRSSPQHLGRRSGEYIPLLTMPVLQTHRECRMSSQDRRRYSDRCPPAHQCYPPGQSTSCGSPGPHILPYSYAQKIPDPEHLDHECTGRHNPLTVAFCLQLVEGCRPERVFPVGYSDRPTSCPATSRLPLSMPLQTDLRGFQNRVVTGMASSPTQGAGNSRRGAVRQARSEHRRACTRHPPAFFARPATMHS